MSAHTMEYTCTSCQKHFIFESDEEAQQAVQNNPSEVRCPFCQEVITNKRGSGRDEGQSHLAYGLCARCGSQTEYFQLPDGSHTILCPECSRAYSSSSY